MKTNNKFIHTLVISALLLGGFSPPIVLADLVTGDEPIVIIPGAATETNFDQTVNGTSGNDFLYGDNMLVTGPVFRNPVITIDNGNDTINGDSGDDLLVGDSGTVIGKSNMTLNNGNDTLYGGDGNDILYGDTRNIVGGLAVNDGDDSLYGEADDDKLYGGGGDDLLNGGTGTNELYGGSGSDTVESNLTGGQDLTLTDTSLVTSGAGLTENSLLDSIEKAALYGGTGSNIMDATGFSGTTYMEGGAGSDTLLGSEQNDELNGGTGIDYLYGFGGDDLLSGGGNDDFLYGGIGNDELNGGAGSDTLFGEEGDDSIFGNSGNDFLSGGIGADTLYGGNDDDTLEGGEGDDDLYGGNGFDTVIQTVDADMFLSDTLLTGQGNDDLDSIENAILTGGDSANTIDAHNFSGTTALYGLGGADTLIGGSNNDYLNGGTGKDLLIGNDGHDYLFGDNGADTLYGNAGDDLLDGWNGDDTIYGGTGNDTLFGWYGDDVLYGGRGSDFLAGEDGNDTLYGGRGDDMLSGGDGKDSLNGGKGDDTLYGDNGNDLLKGGKGDDHLYGGNGDDTLMDGSGDDVLRGNDGNDILISGSGDDILRGGRGDDQLTTTEGDDELYGGKGNDTFTFSAIDPLTQVQAFGGAGENIFRYTSGTQGHYTLTTSSDADTLDFSAFDQSVNIDLSNDTEQEVSTNLWITLVGFFKNLIGSNQDDVLIGNSLDNTIEGRDGSDQLSGKEGVDNLYGGDQSDALNSYDPSDGMDIDLDATAFIGGVTHEDNWYSIELPVPLTAPGPGPVTLIGGGGGFFIPVTGGQLQMLNCPLGTNEVILQLETGDQVRFIGLCGLDAVLDKVPEESLPSTLPVGMTFASDLVINVLEDGKLLELFSTGSIEISFVIPPAFQGKELGLLFWDADSLTWKEIPVDSAELQYPVKLNPDMPEDQHLVFKGLTPNLLRAITQENFSGLFVLVEK